MVSSALNPGSGAIRPVLGSIFASPRPQDIEPTLEEDSASWPRKGKSSEATPPVPARPSVTRPEGSSILPFELYGLEKLVQPEPHTASSTRATSTADRPAEAAGSAESREVMQPVELVRSERKEVPANREYMPLVAGDFPRPSPPELLRDRSQAIDADKKNSQAAGRERDEIQIHIGRIEVTAVPLAPARAASKPARKTLALDEYLKRGDRRV